MKSSEKAYDDLTVIRGIGPARQRWLRESFNVRTYHDLATLSVDEIESRLKADGQIPSKTAIEAWLVQAQERAVAANSSSQQVVESADAEAGGKANSPLAIEGGWESFAIFFVEFQAREIEGRAEEQRRITVSYAPVKDGAWDDDKRTKPIVKQGERLYQWMRDQVGGRMPQVSEPSEEKPPVGAQPAKAPPTEKPSAKIKITQVRVFQPPQSEAPIQTIEAGKPFQGSVKGDEPFTFEVDFELTGPAAPDIARKQIECNARSYAYDQATKTSIDLGHTGPNTFEEGEFAYTFTLPEATLQRGDYRLWVLVTPQGALAMPDFVEVPLFQVV